MPYAGQARPMSLLRKQAAGGADLSGIEGWRQQQDKPVDPDALERLPGPRVALEPALVHPGKDGHAERRGVAAGRSALVARNLHEIGQPRMERLRVEPVGVAAGDAGHARTEAAHDDRRRGIGAEKSRGAFEPIVRAREARTIA